LENAALRQQLAVFKRNVPRPKLNNRDRLFWIGLYMVWQDWKSALILAFYKAVFHARGYRRSPRTCFCANSSAYISSAKQELGELPTPFALHWLGCPVCSTGGTLSPSSNPTR